MNLMTVITLQMSTSYLTLHRIQMFTFGMLTDDDYDSIMGKIHVQEESEPVEPGTIICTTLNEPQGTDEEEGGE